MFDLLLAQYGVGRDGLPGQWPTGYDDPEPYTPAWQEEITGVPAAMAERIGREFAQNAEDSGGRSMIIMGAGTNHWFHSDTIYRTFLTLTTLCGTQGVNGGGWAHYVGQEKCRPVTGWAQLAFGLDWSRPPRQMIGTAFWYVQTDQWRYDRLGADLLASPLGDGRFAGKSMIDTIAQSARSGWMPSYPQFNRSSLDVVAEAEAAGQAPAAYVTEQLKSGDLKFAIEDPDAEENWPRILTVWRANLLGSSSKGNEYFLRHLLGTSNAVRAEEAPEGERPQDVTWRDEAPEGKLDLLVSIDFRMTSTGLFGDILLPAATWYEKHDLSTTDMHPYVHAFTPAIDPPWETRSDYDIFQDLGRAVSELAPGHLGVVKDLVAVPLLHDTPDEMAVPGGVVRDWKTGEVDLIPGVTAPKFVVVERDYATIGAKMSALGPLTASAGMLTKGVPFSPVEEVEMLASKNGVIPDGFAAGRPSLVTDIHACETILALSGTTNGRLSVQGFRAMEKRTGMPLADLAIEEEGKRITFPDTQARPVPVITSPEWSGSEHGGRRYTRLLHQRRAAQAVAHPDRAPALLPRPRLDDRARRGTAHVQAAPEPASPRRRPAHRRGHGGHRPLPDPHSKWSIHSEYQDNLFMLSLSRGGPEIWMSPQDADKIGVKDNEWIEAYNRNGVVVARAIVSHRMPAGTVFMYHAKDRTVDVPKTRPRACGWHPQLAHPPDDQAHAHRGRIRAAVVRLQLPGADRKPARRDHRDPSPFPGGRVLMRVMAQMAMVMNLDKCIGCHTCSVTCKQAWTNRAGVEYVWFNNVETRPGQGYPRTYQDQEKWKGGWVVKRGKLKLRAGGRFKRLTQIFNNPNLPHDAGLLRALDLRVRHAPVLAPGRAHAGGPSQVAHLRQEHEDRVVGQLG